ncbi:MAG: acyl-CoA dehydrogenase family protein [Myxococcota bacterium]
MHFGLTEEQELLQETVRGFVSGECPPQKLREIFDAGAGHDPGLWKGLAEMGLTGLVVPEAHGGAGLEVLELALVCESLGEGALPGPFLGHSLACLAVGLGGSDAQKQRWLPALASGEAIGSVAFAEDAGSWDPADWGLDARDGALTGAKCHVPAAELADLFVVGTAGGGLAVVEKGATGLAVVAAPGIDRTRPVATLRFEATPCQPLENGADAAGRVRDAGLCLLAADAFGAAWALTRMTVEYAKSRRQFGRPIAEFQAVKHQLADMATAIEPTRGLYWYAAHAFDHVRDDAERAAALAKAHISDRAVEIARAAVELHGGLGFTWECDVQMWFKRAMFDRAFLGTPEQHRARVARLGGW